MANRLKRWVYFYLTASSKENSVQLKIRRQINALRELGIDIRGVFLSFDSGIEESLKKEYEHIEFIQLGPIPKGYFQSLKLQRTIYKAFKGWLIKNRGLYDGIYLRFYTSDWLMYRIASMFGNMMLVEYQTINIAELKNLSRQNQFGLKPSRLLSWLEFVFIPILRNILYSRLIAGTVNGIIGVTQEIVEWELKKAWPKKPLATIISNGVAVESLPMRNPPIFDETKLKALILIGSASGSNWNGLDLIVSGIRKYRGKVSIELHVVGDTSEIDGYEDEIIIRHGHLSHQQISELAEVCHIGLGAFALGRKQLTEGSTLKLREYAARGIPCVYGHFDRDFVDLVKMGFALQLSDNASPDFDRIVDFTTRVCADRLHTEKIRSWAENRIDSKVKMKELKQVLDESIK